MVSLTEFLSTLTGEAFVSLQLPAELGQVRVSDRPDLAQFQCNGAMAAARVARRKPREIAEALLPLLEQSGKFASVTIAGPGFINLVVKDEVLGACLRPASAADWPRLSQSGIGRTVLLDYGGPNIAKPMHVGHLRASIIGDTLRRMCTRAGFRALGDVHMGDWGTHMGTILSEYLRTGEAGRILAIDPEDPAACAALMDELMALYPRAANANREDPQRLAESLAATRAMQEGESPYQELWSQIRSVSVTAMRQNFAALNVHFDLWKGEADVHALIPSMVDELRTAGLAEEDDGALILRVAQESDRKEIPPLILHKRDGAVMYGTTDLATLVERQALYAPDHIVYVVDQRQSLHFEQVFRAARAGGIIPADTELTHAGFGTMNGPDGKPFKTRAGGVMRLEDLVEMAMTKARERLHEAHLAEDMDESERSDVARMVAIAAIRFADLQNQRTTDYIFDLERFTAFEGRTGPYILYQVVRIRSLVRKSGLSSEALAGLAESFAVREESRTIALLMAEYPDQFASALRQYMPHLLCEYAFRLANAFSSYYASCKVLAETDASLRDERLAVCIAVERYLTDLLDMLGIEVPARM